MRLPLAIAVLIGLVGIVAPGVPAAERPALSAAAMLERLVDPVAAATPLPPGFRAVQVSSHDRSGGNVDGGWTTDALEPLASTGVGAPTPTFLRDDDGLVLLDEVGPGCLTRMWFTALTSDGGQGDVAVWGNVQVLLDGEDDPRLDVPLADLAAGLDPRFPQPLVGDGEISAGGTYSYVPICFRERLVLRMTGTPNPGMGWYHLQLVTAPAGTPTEVFDPDEFDATAYLHAVQQLGSAPARPADHRLDGPLGSGETVGLDLAGAGTIEHVRFSVNPFDAATLHQLGLRLAVDGAATPQVASPLAPLFGDGGTVRAIHTPGFGMDPDAATGYLGYPVPFRDGARLELASTLSAEVDIDVEVWVGPHRPGPGTLHVEHHTEPTELDTDFGVLRTEGAGHLVGWVLDLVGPPNDQRFFLEGDERGYVDGARSVAFYGTGTEDTFNGAFYYQNGAFALPTHGAGPPGSVGNQRTQSQYRHFGGDTWNWSSSVDLGMEHGGGNEMAGGSATSTTFSYRLPAELVETDRVDLGDDASEAAHGLAGNVARTDLTAFFEGRHDGTVPASAVVIGGLYYPSIPPQASPDGVTDSGIVFAEPLELTVAIDPDNHGVVLRRLIDIGQHPSRIEVRVDGTPVTVWSDPSTNPSKRWREADLDLPSAVTRGKRELELRLTPLAGQENLFDLRVFSRTERVVSHGTAT